MAGIECKYLQNGNCITEYYEGEKGAGFITQCHEPIEQHPFKDLPQCEGSTKAIAEDKLYETLVMHRAVCGSNIECKQFVEKATACYGAKSKKQEVCESFLKSALDCIL